MQYVTGAQLLFRWAFQLKMAARYVLRRHRAIRLGKELSLKATFDHIYTQHLWGGPERLSGDGSYGPWADGYLKLLRGFICDHSITSITDIGCGDFAIGAAVCNLVDRYEAIDASAVIIARNVKMFSDKSHVRFSVMDACETTIPKSDLVTVRQVLQHLTNAEVERVLTGIEDSGSRWAIIAEDVPAKCRPNIDLPAHCSYTRGDFFRSSGVFIDQAPFYRTAQVIGTIHGHVRHLRVWLWPLAASKTSLA